MLTVQPPSATSSTTCSGRLTLVRLSALVVLQATQLSRESLIEDLMPYVRLLTEQLLLRAKTMQG